MSKFASVLKVVGVIAAVVAVGVLLGWLAGRSPQTAAPVQSAKTAPTAQPDQPASPGAAPQTNSGPRPLVQHPSPRAAARAAAAPNPNLITNWEDRVDVILTTEEPEAEKAKKMLAMFPNLPEQGQLEVAQHLSNLVPDEDYASLARYLTDPSLPQAVLDVLFGDVLNRPNNLKLPALLDVARDPDNPNATQAHDILEMFLEEDYGTDWNIWQVKVEHWLKDNPN